MRSDLPDVVVVVMDCVREDLFEQQLAAGALPHLAKVRDEFLRFPKAVAPASWTIPSHASLFTGLYPWDHGAHYKAGAVLGPAPRTLAEYLRDRGYRTASYSANGYVQPGTGLTRGFDRALWGGDREFFLRVLAREASCPSLNGADAAVHAILDTTSRASPLRVGAMRALSRFTPLCDAFNRVGGKMLETSPAYVGQWVEREFEAGMRASSDRPVFGFVNLLEAHEPYLAEGGLPVGLADWLAYARTTQVAEQWKTGESVPSADDRAWARRDYLASLRVIDARVGALIDRMKELGRWENALFVLTSDHGQRFGETGSMYHRLDLEEEITRIPLWYKPPRGSPASPGVHDGAWVSLVDVPVTVASTIEPGTAFGSRDSVPLDAAETAPPRTVYSMTDGLPAREAKSLTGARREKLDRVQIAGYRGPFKTIADQSGVEYRFRLEAGGARLVPNDDPTYDHEAFAEIPARLRAGSRLTTPAA